LSISLSLIRRLNGSLRAKLKPQEGDDAIHDHGSSEQG
jgi:hypothetical protein